MISINLEIVFINVLIRYYVMYVYLLLCENEKFGKIYLKFSLLNLLIIWVWIDFRFIDNIK